MNRIKFGASRVGDLMSGGTGKTRMNYIFELAEASVDAKKNITTKQMLHGIVNERNALDILCKKRDLNPNTNEDGKQVYYSINEYIGATPDAIGFDAVGDAKCQYSISGFIEQNDKMKSAYYYQLQTQMMALKVDKAYLINYLTKPEVFGQDDWVEYPFDIEERYFIHDVVRDEKVCDDILIAAETNYPLIWKCSEMLQSAIEIDDEAFFYMQLQDKIRFAKFKDTAWLNSEKQVYRHNNEFYVIKK
jgi:hypothetical protein